MDSDVRFEDRAGPRPTSVLLGHGDLGYARELRPLARGERHLIKGDGAATRADLLEIFLSCAAAFKTRLATQLLRCSYRERSQRFIVFLFTISVLENYFKAFSIRLGLTSVWEGVSRTRDFVR
jgi:hypothetical protein